MKDETFGNPIINIACDILGIENEPEFILIDCSESECNIRLYNLSDKIECNSPYEIRPALMRDVVKVLNNFMKGSNVPYPNVLGTDLKTAYDSVTHRGVKEMRVFLPSCFLQIEYEDEFVFLGFLDLAAENLRETFQLKRSSD